MDASQKTKVRVPMSRPGLGRRGQKVPVCTNHFRVRFAESNDYFFQYSVDIYYEDGKPVEPKGIGRKIIDKIDEIYKAELGGKAFVYDGEKALFTFGPLPGTKLTFPVVVERVSSDRTGGTTGSGSPGEEDRKRRKCISQTKIFNVEISFATKIPIKAINDALRGKESEECADATRVLDIVLRQHAAKQGCLLVRQSFFHNDVRATTDLGGGIDGCWGFHSSFRATQNGLSLNMDVSVTTIVRPGSVIDFLIGNQNARDSYHIDWAKAKRTLRKLRISVSPANTEWEITGLSEEICKNQRFLLKRRSADKDGNVEETEMTVYDYFIKIRNIPLRNSGDLPCINVGKSKRPTYIPIELCSLLPLQRYTKALTIHQRSSLVKEARQNPQEKMGFVTDALRRSNYTAEPILSACGISINSDFMQVDSRVLPAPKLKFKGKEEVPKNGRWNVKYKKFVDHCTLNSWVVVNFSAISKDHTDKLIEDLQNCAILKGINIEPPQCVIMEDSQYRQATPTVRVQQMIEQMKSRLSEPPEFVLCILAKKNSEIYGPWKKKALTETGFFTQCLAPGGSPNDQYLTNLLLKINAKLGGLNHLVEVQPNIPVFIKKPTIIFGMDVCHGSPGQSEVPSIAAVVSSRTWPSICRYRASVRSQSPKVEMIDSLKDRGIIKELVDDFSAYSGGIKPLQVIIFRDGVSESQFKQVLNIEFDQIQQAFAALDESRSPQFTIIVAQKNHHTKFFEPGSSSNVSPGTVIDTQVCHPQYYDFYMCAHAGNMGTSRPTHYHVLLDEIGFSPDELQELVHSLSYVYQRSTTAISIVAPIRYAHLAATQASHFLKYEDQSSSHGSMTSAGTAPVPELPKLRPSVKASMFFC